MNLYIVVEVCESHVTKFLRLIGKISVFRICIQSSLHWCSNLMHFQVLAWNILKRQNATVLACIHGH